MEENKQIEVVNQKALVVVESLHILEAVTNDAENQLAADLWQTGNEMLAEIGKGYDDLIKSAHKLHKDLVARKKRYADPVEQGMVQLKRMMVVYKQKQDAVKAAAQKALDDAKAAEVAKLVEANKVEEAVTVANTKVVASPAMPAQKVQGGPVIQKRYHAEVTDFSLLPDKYKLPDMVTLNRLAVAEKEKLDIPGVKAVGEDK